MRKFILILLSMLSVLMYAETTGCEYDIKDIECDDSVISIEQDSIDSCRWSLTAIPPSDYKFAFWVDKTAKRYYDTKITISLIKHEKNYLYDVVYVRDNSYIYQWNSDSVIIRTDTTDLLSGVLTDGYTLMYVDSTIITVDHNSALVRKDYGIWTNPITVLTEDNNYAGKPLHMIIFNSCSKPSAVIDTIVPYMAEVDCYTSTIDKTVVDIQVCNGATLYIDRNTTISGIVDIHENGKVVVQEGKTLECNGIIMRGNGISRQWPQLLVYGSVTNHNSNIIYYDYTLDSYEYYPIALSSDVYCNTLTNAINGGTPSFQTYVYNTEKRNSGISGWEEFNDAAENAKYSRGKGYIMYAPANKWKNLKAYRQKNSVIRFPLAMDLSSGEETEKSIGVDSYGVEVSNNSNWNLIGSPYLSDYTIDETHQITVNDNPIRYITYSTDGYQTYEQEKIDGFTIKPFNSYFVQIENGSELVYSETTPRKSVVANKQKTNKKEIETGVVFEQSNRKERIGLIYGNYTDNYDINADLEKMFGNVDVFTAYSLSKENTPLVFQALPFESMSNLIPIGYKNAEIIGTNVYFDNERYNYCDVKAIWLFDKVENTYTNLLYEQYWFMPLKRNEDRRFYISVEYNAEDATELTNVEFRKDKTTYNILGQKLDNMSQNRGIYIVNNNGKKQKVVTW